MGFAAGYLHHARLVFKHQDGGCVNYGIPLHTWGRNKLHATVYNFALNAQASLIGFVMRPGVGLQRGHLNRKDNRP